ncbi:MAG: UDP-N-acetylglucosamine 1-carboxyvinyltransferase [Candidatus Staskawiczbacteria bacterium]|nr:UDP-N-acetylglucosamine 1-carboxyvinyltransferase [Candidatus Staskawiczbacteria bacterium]
MEKFIIKGQSKLSGAISVNGAKNSALKILAALILSEEKCKITNFPFIEDTLGAIELLKDLGAKAVIDREGKIVEIDPSSINKTKLDSLLVRRLRSSILMAGPMLARFGNIEMEYPGGCVIGKRPIDMFLDGFLKLGAKVDSLGATLKLSVAGKKLIGSHIFFPQVTVTGTEAMIMAAVLAEGKTVLQNCAMEPEIPALADYLNRCGAKITGAGTPTIEIEGVDKISGGEFNVIPDRIEAGTFIIMGLLTKSELKIENCTPEHLGAVLSILERAGAKLEIGADYIITKPSKMKAFSITTHEYPGFVTDLQPPYTLLMTQAEGQSIIHESIFEGRLFFTDQLSMMGANVIMCDPHRVVVNGPTQLFGKKMMSPDIRAGITLVLAGMVAEGETVIENIYQIDRGYEKIEERLQKIGADIERI